MRISSRVGKESLRGIAAKPLSAEPRPFLRWAGSKRAVLSELVDVLPESFGTYWEPFLGSGALFFLLQPPRAVLSDSCEDLIATFRTVRDRPEIVLKHLRPLRADRDQYYLIRGARSRSEYKRAAHFLYLNKMGWNGLYRVNSKGIFNVPFGRPRTDFIVDPSNLRACAKALSRRQVRLKCGDFEATLSGARRGDLVYLDPPYVTGHNNNGFIDYNERLFSWADQIRLAKVSRSLVSRGVSVILTNAHHDPVLHLFEGFKVKPLHRSSTLAGKADKRTRVTEAILYMV